MNRAALIATFRRDVADEDEPFLWGADDAQTYLDDAINEAADRARLLRDSTTPEICEVTIAAGTHTYPLDSRILSVIRAKLDLGRRPLDLTSTVALDRGIGASSSDARVRSNYGWTGTSYGLAWESLTGTPTRIAIDAQASGWTARLVPAPTVSDTLRLQVYRLPLDSLTEDDDEPEINSRLHIRLVDWMKHLAYSKQDTETRNDKKAEMFANLFTSAFGERIDANVRRAQRDRHPAVVAFQEF